jgi:hypothetical protein
MWKFGHEIQIIRFGKIQIPSSTLEEFRGSLGRSLTVFPLSKNNGLEAVWKQMMAVIKLRGFGIFGCNDIIYGKYVCVCVCVWEREREREREMETDSQWFSMISNCSPLKYPITGFDI